MTHSLNAQSSVVVDDAENFDPWNEICISDRAFEYRFKLLLSIFNHNQCVNVSLVIAAIPFYRTLLLCMFADNRL